MALPKARVVVMAAGNHLPSTPRTGAPKLLLKRIRTLCLASSVPIPLPLLLETDSGQDQGNLSVQKLLSCLWRGRFRISLHQCQQIMRGRKGELLFLAFTGE